jgi:PAS domain S-box-containing protein
METSGKREMCFKDLSIRKKLILLLMGISTTAVLAACLTFYFLIVDRYQQSYLDDLQILTRINAANCSASLAFGIPEDAEHLLSSLSKRPSITAATIRDLEGQLFVSYSNTGSPATNATAITPAFAAPDLRPQDLRISNPIEINGKDIGEITLYDDMGTIRTFKRIVLFTLIGVIVVVSGLTALFAVRLTEIVSKPISTLVDVAQKITTLQDYSLRAKKESEDEVGNLVDVFNTMLAQISQRTEELEKSENRFRSFINQAVDSIFLHDMEGRFVDVNKHACDSLGYSREELLSMTVEDIDPAADTQQYRQKYWARVMPETSVTIEGRYHRKDGDSFPVEVRVGLLELSGEKLIMALARDISERVDADQKRLQLESQLQQAQKMESIGTLAGGIAHDFNNILTPILGYVELATLKTTGDRELTGYLQEVRKATERAREMVKQILTFSRRHSESVLPIQVQVIVKEALKLLRASIPTTIEIRQNIDPHCGSVLANPSQIHQIIMNLCTNAYHAMRETGGVLGVSLLPLEITTNDIIKNIKNINLKPGSYLRLEASDTGCGMDKATMKKIFEPYFTTKEKGEGTGLGLSVVHGVVKSIGGHITVYSEPGEGCTFHIYLPVIESSISRMDTLYGSPIPTGTEEIMLVDDEQTVREMTKAMLTGLGYQVKIFGNPFEALELFTAQPDIFDLVITDMTMPKMTGDKLAQAIMKIRPAMPVILCTGFSDLINEESAKALGIREYVTKPITRQSFARTVRSILDGRQTESNRRTDI